MYSYFDGENWVYVASAESMKNLVTTGVITPETKIRLPGDREGLAGKLYGLGFFEKIYKELYPVDADAPEFSKTELNRVIKREKYGYSLARFVVVLLMLVSSYLILGSLVDGGEILFVIGLSGIFLLIIIWSFLDGLAMNNALIDENNVFQAEILKVQRENQQILKILARKMVKEKLPPENSAPVTENSPPDFVLK